MPLLPLGQDLEQELGAAAVEFHVAQLVQAEQVDAAVAGDGLGELAVVGGFDELVDPGRRNADPSCDDVMTRVARRGSAAA